MQLGTMSKPNPDSEPAKTAEELAARWEKIDKLPPSEAEAFAKDIEESRRKLRSPVKPIRKRST